MAIGTGNLPYTMSPVSPFDVITSQAENERIANIESLADGTGIGDGAVPLPAINGGTTAGVLVTDASGNLTAQGAWASWTPTLTGITLGNGTLIAKYIKVGNTVHFNIHITFGSTSSVGNNQTISLPVASNPDTYQTNTTPNIQYNLIGSGFIRAGSTTTAAYPSIDGVTGNSATRAIFNTSPTSVSSATTTSPGTWGTGSRLQLSGTYEAA